MRKPTIDARLATNKPMAMQNSKAANPPNTRIHVMTNTINRGAVQIHRDNLKNLSTILICNGTQILKTVLSLCKGRRFLVYYVVTFSPIEILELLAMLNLLLELLFSFLPSLK